MTGPRRHPPVTPQATVGSPKATTPPSSSEDPLPAPGFAEVGIVAASPEAARQVAETLRRLFPVSEQRSHPSGHQDGGTSLHLTVDTLHTPDVSESFRPWLVTDHPYTDDA
jgi:hypothetical protein